MDGQTVRRIDQVILIVTFAAFSWLMMRVVHELGQIATAGVSGTEIIKISLHPLVFLSTDVWNPSHPLLI
jgi:hypothetical protein